ncbi:ABC transporter substrate-binding protein [Fusobacterium hominis]|uniref:ABC transporter substrate-binding protein n=2 Tax=Fusobacterium TaxID=848 RepID=A0A7G9GY47_9FUSO|nr:ABC transporter substrate-binding protein [Fusobacterium hominis]QNM15729.1 ABC transporter substrate-binding protein [Fusobacterium hominis]
MRKKFIFVMFLFCFTISLFAKNIKVLTPSGLPALSLVKMVNENKQIAGNNIEYKIEKNSDALVVDMLKREGDIAIVPSNFAAQLYNKNLDYVILGTVGWGSFYIVSDKKITSLKELKNKQIYTFGRGLTPDIVLRNILLNNGINLENDIKINYVTSGNELPPLFIGGKANIINIPEPMLSTLIYKDKKAYVNFNLNDIWKNLYKTKYGYPQSTLVVKKEILDKNPQFIKSFLENLESSIKFLYGNSDNKNDYINRLNIMINMNVIDNILLKANIDFIRIDNCKQEYENYFKVLNQFNSKVLGGNIPDEKIFATFN